MCDAVYYCRVRGELVIGPGLFQKHKLVFMWFIHVEHKIMLRGVL